MSYLLFMIYNDEGTYNIQARNILYIDATVSLYLSVLQASPNINASSLYIGREITFDIERSSEICQVMRFKLFS